MSQTFTYDGNGNRLTQGGTSSTTYTIASTSNRLSSTSGALARTYTYDAAENVLSYATLTNTYNNAGRMKTSKVGSTTTTYVYNALGQRVKKSGGAAGTVLYWYDEAGHLLGEYGSTGTLVQETVWLGDIPVATLRPGSPVAIYYVHTDHLNTPRKITRPSDDALLWRWDSDPFGTTAPNENPASLGTFHYHLRFPGQYFDTESGLSYNYFRDYDPQIGRYAESDPIGQEGGPNPYSYVPNPVSEFDSLGLMVTGPGVLLYRFKSAQFYWHGNWGGPGWAAGRWVSETNLSDADRSVPAKDRRDACYKNHDFCMRDCSIPCQNESGTTKCRHCDHLLATCLRRIPPWDPSYWGSDLIARYWLPFTAISESVWFDTLIPYVVH